ncbi:hypothetical protein GQ600_26481 [Phytophthora cactorum]|nr:hypothetical protein GQ600_26481 [Phytophthora cactorum]
MEGPDAEQQAKQRPPSDPGGTGRRNSRVRKRRRANAVRGADEPQEAKGAEGHHDAPEPGTILTTGREQCTRQGAQDQEISGQAWGAEEAVSPIRNYHRNRRFPKLNGEESAHLLKFLEEACVVDNFLGSMTRKGKRAMVPVLNRGRKNQAGRSAGNGSVAAKAADQIQHFMFNPNVYNSRNYLSSCGLCARRRRSYAKARRTSGKIIQGLAEGTITQIEGDLILSLAGYCNVPVNRQNTQALNEDILSAAESVKVCLVELRSMLSETKTISCNRPQKIVHFLFFDGETAVNYQLTLVPFRRTLYRLANKQIPRRDCVIAVIRCGRRSTRALSGV